MKTLPFSSAMATMYRLIVLTLFMWTSDAAEITAKPGDDVALLCQGPRDKTITVIAWSRPDLKTGEYVFFFVDGRPDESSQHASFRGRVQLKDPHMKNGNVSVVLKNVTIKDTGTYECQVAESGSEPELITTITLKVADSGHSAGGVEDGDVRRPVGLIVGLTFGVAAVAAAAVGSVIYIRKKNQPSQNTQ